jgi:hypothetical protein
MNLKEIEKKIEEKQEEIKKSYDNVRSLKCELSTLWDLWRAEQMKGNHYTKGDLNCLDELDTIKE